MPRKKKKAAKSDSSGVRLKTRTIFLRWSYCDVWVAVAPSVDRSA